MAETRIVSLSIILYLSVYSDLSCKVTLSVRRALMNKGFIIIGFSVQ